VNKMESIAALRKRAHTKFLALESTAYRKFVDLEQATFRDGALSRREKELIAVGISVVRNCESCMQWHIEHAAKHGASSRQILETLEVAIEMGGGPATVAARFALEVMDDVFGDETAEVRQIPDQED
jgi:AhpD family alkylhydroperoxidase